MMNVQENIVQTESNECEYGDENEYDNTIEEVEPTPIVESYLPITEYERTLLCNIVANEAGSDWIGIYDKASVVACVMNRVNSPDFPNTIEGVLTQPYQFSGYYASSYYYSTVTDACIQAVDYYFNNPNEFGSWLYFEGNGTNNYFH
jgi:spore germination cell wall hydrolase CwlJ-like protein